MGLRFRSTKKEAQPLAVTTRVGPDAGWSIRTWTGQIAPPPAAADTAEHDEEREGST